MFIPGNLLVRIFVLSCSGGSFMHAVSPTVAVFVLFLFRLLPSSSENVQLVVSAFIRSKNRRFKTVLCVYVRLCFNACSIFVQMWFKYVCALWRGLASKGRCPLLESSLPENCFPKCDIWG